MLLSQLFLAYALLNLLVLREFDFVHIRECAFCLKFFLLSYLVCFASDMLCVSLMLTSNELLSTHVTKGHRVLTSECEASKNKNAKYITSYSFILIQKEVCAFIVCDSKKTVKCEYSFYQERQACRNKIHIRGELKRGASEASKNMGPGACPQENVSSPIVGKRPTFENVLLTEAEDHY